MNKMLLANIIFKEMCIVASMVVIYGLWGKERWQKVLSIWFFVVIATVFYVAGFMQ